jgi:hypothetical protein
MLALFKTLTPDFGEITSVLYVPNTVSYDNADYSFPDDVIQPYYSGDDDFSYKTKVN